jgi:hypothetical protein
VRRADRDVRGRAADDARLEHASPRASRRRSAARSPPAKRGSEASSARWRSVSALALGRRPRCAAKGGLGLVPLGGSSSESARPASSTVVARHPQRERDEVGRQPCLEHPARLERRVLGVRGHAGDHADDVARAEGHDEHRADADALGRT